MLTNSKNNSLIISTNNDKEENMFIEENIENNDKPKNENLIKNMIDNIIKKKTSYEAKVKNQIEMNKKDILEKFYSKMLTGTTEANTEPENKKDINEKLLDYEELKEIYKNERAKKKSSIFKSEDLLISNTHLINLNNNDDYSPINPNVVNIENQNNIFIIQKKLFENGENEEFSKIENYDEIDDMNFDDINIREPEKESFNNELLEQQRVYEYFYLSNPLKVKNNNNNKNLKNNIIYKKRAKCLSIQFVSKIDYLINKTITKEEENKYSLPFSINTTINTKVNNNSNTKDIKTDNKSDQKIFRRNSINSNNIKKYLNNIDNYFDSNINLLKRGGLRKPKENSVNGINSSANKENQKTNYNNKNNEFIYSLPSSRNPNNSQKKSELYQNGIYSYPIENNIQNFKNPINLKFDIKNNNILFNKENKLKYGLLNDFKNMLANAQSKNLSVNQMNKKTNFLPVRNGLSTNKKIINTSIKNYRSNRIKVINSINNNQIKFSKLIYKIEALDNLKVSNQENKDNFIYILYVRKILSGYLYNGLYKKLMSDTNSYTCQKICSIPNMPMTINYNNLTCLYESGINKFTKLNNINTNKSNFTILVLHKD